MSVEKRRVVADGFRFTISENGAEIARAFLYIMHNDGHDRPFGLLEDVHVNESERGLGLGTRLVQAVVDAARESGCYKLIATSRYSRPRVHELYKRLGFGDHGKEFRMDLP
jgi:GNAT superfamily N-acetyltransferase